MAEDATLACTLDALVAALLDALPLPGSAVRARRVLVEAGHWEALCARASSGTLSAAELYEEPDLWAAFAARLPQYAFDSVRRPDGRYDLEVTLRPAH